MFNETFTTLLKDYLLNGKTDAIYDRKAIAGLLNDIIPQEPKLRRALLYLHELGFHDEIAMCESMTDDLVRRFRLRLINEFGLGGKHANWAIYVWCACYGRDILGKPYEISATDRDYAAITYNIKLYAKPDVTANPDASDTDADVLWKDIVHYLSKSPGDMVTSGEDAKWFFAFTKEDIVFITNAMSHSPRVEFETPLSVTKKEFYDLYKLYKSKGMSKYTNEKTPYIFSIIRKALAT